MTPSPEMSGVPLLSPNSATGAVTAVVVPSRQRFSTRPATVAIMRSSTAANDARGEPTGATEPADVAFLLPNLAGGGVERVVLNLSAALVAAGRSVEVVLLRAEGELLASLDKRVRVVELGVTVPSDALFVLGLPALTRYLRARPPRVLYSGMTSLNVMALWARRRSRAATAVVVSEHVPVSVNATTHPLKRLLPAIVRRAYPHADAIVAVATALADDLARVARIPRERIDVVYNPVVTPRLLTQAQQPPEHPWFADDAPIVLGIGRLTPQKDFVTLIEAFALLRARRQCRLLILGEGEQRAELEALVRQRGLEEHVALPGFVPNPASYLGHADAFALSSRYEGLAVVLIEALACGCPVVSTDCLSGPDEILESGRYGRLVPVADPRALADALDATLEAPLPAETLRERAAAFTVEAIAPRYTAIFDRVTVPRDVSAAAGRRPRTRRGSGSSAPR